MMDAAAIGLEMPACLRARQQNQLLLARERAERGHVARMSGLDA
jgi:hypothetical protein